VRHTKRTPRPVPLCALLCAASLAAACTDGGGADSDATSVTTTTGVASTTSIRPPTSAPTTQPTTTTLPGEQCEREPTSCTLAEAAVVHDIRVGVALGTPQIGRPDLAQLVASEFTQITPENELKWRELEPNPGDFRFDRADALVAFAETNGMEVRGHALVWGLAAGNGTPDWVRNLGSADELRRAMEQSITTIVGRYRGRIARWDVVNEPLDNPGTTLDDNRFTQLLGPEYIDLAFQLARQADPEAELWINEVDAEVRPERAAALVALVDELLARGVPIDGVGLQSHLVSGSVPPNGQLERLVAQLRDRGLRVAVTELDIPVIEGDGDPFGTQAFAFAEVTRQCIRAGCEEISVWGVSDADSWLNRLLNRRAQPLLFDDALVPKPAYDALREALADR
jgi:endo-1,4-beta-xylanase